jgi:alkylation response protein AidB-like acyl-CoA dehydrogenase
VSDPAAWEARAQAWSDENPPPRGAAAGSRAPTSDAERDEWLAWGRSLHAAGLAVLHWPEEWGGEQAAPDEVRAVTRVLRAGGHPLPLTDVAINLVSPAIMQYGTDEQKKTHLPEIADGTAVWTQLFSEPGAGSDLASLRVKATPHPDGGWVLSGQKVWNTYAHVARWGYCLARTGPVDSRHRGLSMFMVPMDADGIRVVPITEMTGDADFNEVFLDDVHLGPECLLGDVDGGWAVSMGTLAAERRVVGGLVLGIEADARRLARLLDELGPRASTAHRVRLGEIYATIEALVTITQPGAGFPENFESAGKILFSDLNIALSQLSMDVCAAHPGAAPDGWARRWADNYAYSRGYSISGGANELLRNVLAQRGLGLPRP